MLRTARTNMKKNQHNVRAEALHETRRPAFHPSTIWAVTLATLTLSACATLGSTSPQEQVTQRANQRWQALIDADFTRAYNFNTPGYRAAVNSQTHRASVGSAVAWVGAEAVKIDCPDINKCTATVRIDFKPLMGGRYGEKINTHIDETWLFEDGQWWYFQPFKSN